MAPRRQDAIFRAALELLAEKGYEGLTVEGVAERSGVNKTTIYRWWPSKAALLGAALTEADLIAFDTPDTGSLRGDLEALARQIATLLTTPPVSDLAVAMLAAAVHNPELAQAAQRFFADRLARERPVFERAIARGELAAGTDTMAIMDLLGGAIWMRAVFRQLPLDQDFPRRLVALVLDGVRLQQL